MEKLGVNIDGVSTTWLAGATDLRRPVDKRLAQSLELVVNSNYREFIGAGGRAPQLNSGKDQRGRAGAGVDRRAGKGTRSG